MSIELSWVSPPETLLSHQQELSDSLTALLKRREQLEQGSEEWLKLKEEDAELQAALEDAFRSHFWFDYPWSDLLLRTMATLGMLAEDDVEGDVYRPIPASKFSPVRRAVITPQEIAASLEIFDRLDPDVLQRALAGAEEERSGFSDTFSVFLNYLRGAVRCGGIQVE